MSTDDLSLTKYYSLFHTYLLTVKKLVGTQEIAIPFSAAMDIATQGLKLEEQTNPLTMKSMVGEMGDWSGLLGKERDVVAEGKTRQYAFPDIQSHQTLLLAIAYMMHMNNYANAHYKGPITTFLFQDALSQINASVEGKKVWNAAQAQAIQAEVQAYCLAQNIDYQATIAQHLTSNKAEVLSQIYRALCPSATQQTGSVDELRADHTQAQADYSEKFSQYHAYSRQIEQYVLAQYQIGQLEEAYQTQSVLWRMASFMFNWLIPFNDTLVELHNAQRNYEKIEKKLLQLTPQGETIHAHFDALTEELEESQTAFNKLQDKYYHQLVASKYEADNDAAEAAQNQANEQLQPPATISASNQMAPSTQATSTFASCASFFEKIPTPTASQAAIGVAATVTTVAASYYMLS
jgi:hypothetical protein